MKISGSKFEPQSKLGHENCQALEPDNFVESEHYTTYMVFHHKEPVIQTQIAKFMGPTWGPPGSYRPQMGPILAPWTLLSGELWCFFGVDMSKLL